MIGLHVGVLEAISGCNARRRQHRSIRGESVRDIIPCQLCMWNERLNKDHPSSFPRTHDNISALGLQARAVLDHEFQRPVVLVDFE